MRQVTQQEFFAALKADPRDIMPTAKSGFRSEWRENNKPWSLLWGVTESDGAGKDTFLINDQSQ